ncbi:MAG: Crp/Fnr family transcriptional regulator [Candidatus Sphingomonas colombiensis]|nr:Crp/Fnr family transcriptional regulator [Sphingomonas sp.]WEK43805.1 MAG: Crp/Fnr family transcriptional regulator [Sphingomonas sp.]
MDVEALALRAIWFAHLPAPLRAALLRAGRVVRLAPGQWVYGEGDEETGLVLVLDGALRIEASLGAERDVLVNLAPAGSAFGQSRRGGGGPRIATARAAARATIVLLIADSALERVAADQPALWRAVSELVYGQLDAMVHLAAQLIGLNPRGRIAARLLALGGGGVAAVSQADLAEMCGLSRKVTNMHLAALEHGGAITRGYGRIVIVAPAILRRLAA